MLRIDNFSVFTVMAVNLTNINFAPLSRTYVNSYLKVHSFGMIWN